jgi:hypothetical protein
MVQNRKAPETVRLTLFAKACLGELVTRLGTTKPVTEVDEPDLAGALIYAASRSPLEAVRANIGAYRDIELDHGQAIAAVEAVGRFLRSGSR